MDLEAGVRMTGPELQLVAAGLPSDTIITSYLGPGQDGLASGGSHPTHGGEDDPVQRMEADGGLMHEPAPPSVTPTAGEDAYLLRLAISCVSLAIKISYHGIFSTTWVAAEAAAALGLGDGDHGRLYLVMMLLGLLVAALVLQVLLTAQLGRSGMSCSRRYQVILLCLAAGVLVLTVVVMALRVVSASYLAASLFRGRTLN